MHEKFQRLITVEELVNGKRFKHNVSITCIEGLWQRAGNYKNCFFLIFCGFTFLRIKSKFLLCHKPCIKLATHLISLSFHYWLYKFSTYSRFQTMDSHTLIANILKTKYQIARQYRTARFLLALEICTLLLARLILGYPVSF